MRRSTRELGAAAGVLGLALVAACAATSRPHVERPGYLTAWQDPSTGAAVRRITGDAGAPLGIAGTRAAWSGDARHHYSKDQPWNADGTLLALENRGTGPILLDGNSYRPLRLLGPLGLDDFRWHPARDHARVLIGVRETSDSLVWVDAVSGRQERGWKLPLRPDAIGMGEGNPSRDGRFLALANAESIVVVDMDPREPHETYAAGARRIGPVLVVPPCSLVAGDPARCPIGNVSVSASGSYLDLKFASTPGADSPDLHRIFEIDPQTLAIRPHRMAGSSERCGEFGDRPNGWIFPLKHADLGIDPFDGDADVIVGGRSCPGSSLGRVVKVRLADGRVTALTDPRGEPSVAHVSLRNLDRPGWAYVTYLEAPGKRLGGEIVAVKLDGSREVERIARHRSEWKNCYRCQAQAVPSRDGRRVMWASNWAADCRECAAAGVIGAYVAERDTSRR